MNAFVFGDNIIKIEIQNLAFENEAVMVETEICAAKRIINEFNNKMTAGEADKETIKDAMHEITGKIDSALGENAVKNILKGKEKVSLYDLMDIVIYVTECINEFEMEKRQFYNNYKAKNREQRRHQNKK